MEKPKVIAISAVSGGGKTTVIKELARKYKKSKIISFDDYTFPNTPRDYYQWSTNGADCNLWKMCIRDRCYHFKPRINKRHFSSSRQHRSNCKNNIIL